MRRITHLLSLIAAFAVLPTAATFAAPLPSITFYGMLVDEFGWPYETNVRVEVHSQGEQIFSRSIAPARGLAYNFLIRVPYDSGVSADSYSASALTPGENIALKISALETGAVLINTNFVVNFFPGSVLNVNLSAGTDSIGDGLPDELRRWIWQNTGGFGAFDPRNIRAGDDSDFDGVSNLDEYSAGTDPANIDDVLRVDVTPSEVPNIGALNFYTVPGKTYQIQSGDLSPDNLWTTATFANSPTGPATFTEFVGTGHYVSLFVPTDGGKTFYRVFVAGRTPGAVVQ